MKTIALIFFMSISTVASAEWSVNLTVDRMFTENSDLIVIYTSGGEVMRDGCIANKWVFKADNEDRRNRAYSTAMAGLVSGKNIQLNISGTQTGCGPWSFHEASAIMLIK